MSSFIKGLGLDLFDFKNKFVCITEENNADANFCIGALISQALSDQTGGVCLLTLHHSILHYYHVGMRLGHNLSSLVKRRFNVVDSVDILDATNGLKDNVDELLKTTFFLLKNKLDQVRENCGHVFILIDDLSDFMNMGLSTKDIVSFVQYLRLSLENEETLVICSHYSKGDEDQEFIKNFLTLTCDLRLDVKSLETGFSKEVTGSITLTRKDMNNVSCWSPSAFYHYKTGERTIKVFPPGNISFSYTV